MAVSDIVVEPVKGTGKGIVAGGKKGGKIGALGGAIAAGLGVLAIGSAIALPALLIGAVSFAAGVMGGAVALGAIAATVGAVMGGLGGGWLGASAGGLFGMGKGVVSGVKGIKKGPEKNVSEQMDMLRTQSAISDGQVAQAEAYLQEQQIRQAGIESLKQQRAEAAAAVANPNASDKNAAKIMANTSETTRTTSTLSV